MIVKVVVELEVETQPTHEDFETIMADVHEALSCQEDNGSFPRCTGWEVISAGVI